MYMYITGLELGFTMAKKESNNSLLSLLFELIIYKYTGKSAYKEPTYKELTIIRN